MPEDNGSEDIRVVTPGQAGGSAALPAFYAVDSDDAEGLREPDSNRGGHEIVDEEMAEMGSVEELLAAHKRSEDQLCEDRRQGVSSQSRWRLEARAKRKSSSADELELAYISKRHTVEGTPLSFHGDAVKSKVGALFPRHKRKVQVHSSSKLLDHDAMEQDTDISDNEEDAPNAIPKAP